MILQLYLLLLLLLLLCFSSCFCLHETLSSDQSITDGTVLVSKGNTFALGFFSPGMSTYRYLGIWYHNLSEQTVVWVANRNNPINGSSGILSMDQYGRNLVLHSHLGQQVPVWSTNVSVEEGTTDKDTTTSTCVAQLLDSGNLILILQQHGSDGLDDRVIWQSFDYPTDTMLPGMKLGLDLRTGRNTFLTSWRSTDDPGIGDFSFKLKHGGSPHFSLSNMSTQIWRTAPWPWIMNLEVTPIYVYRYNFLYNQDVMHFDYGFFEGGVTARMVLCQRGYFHLYSWHENKWVEFWSAPKEPCDRYRTCGAYSVCGPTYFNRQFCSCLPGYEPKSPGEWYLRDGTGGCVKKRPTTSTCSSTDGFTKMERMKLPDTALAASLNRSLSHKECEHICLTNCSCTAFASLNINGTGAGCILWYGELLDSLQQTTDCYDLYIRVDATELAEISRASDTVPEKKGMLAVLVLSLAAAWLSITLIVFLWLNRRKRRAKSKWNKSLLDSISKSKYYKDTSQTIEIGGNKSHQDLVLFNLKTLIVATNSFSPGNKVGEGGFGSVYKGKLPNGREIAIKRLSKDSGQGMEEFKNEVMLIAKLQHRNLVKLLGCCTESEEPMLIYEYLPNKSLDLFLFDKTKSSILDWRKRFNIIVGIARGILYLHQDSRLRIIHRDIKTSNVLLDAEMNPKISDFGMARIFKGDEVQDRTKRVVGTYGYMAPEYVVFGKFSIKSDVFSFGVVLLEIVSGKKNNGICLEDPSLGLIGHVWELWRGGRTLEIIDPSMGEDSFSFHDALRCIQIGLLCVQEKAVDRPTMLEVALMLNSEVPLPTPKPPAFVFRTSCASSDLSKEERACSINDLTISKILSR